MSYCRWSSMNWGCDVYVYENVSGYWTTHVAGRRRIFPPIPDIGWRRMPSFGAVWDKEARAATYPSKWHRRCAHAFYWLANLWHRLHMFNLGLIPLRTIGLPHDGETFNDAGPAECADTLESLSRAGYVVPQNVIKALREEAADAAGHTECAACGGYGLRSRVMQDGSMEDTPCEDCNSTAAHTATDSQTTERPGQEEV
jgi:hypothetical protein